jgi:ATP-dependent DNA helicase RecQ
MQQAYAALKKYFGYDTFRPMQEDIIRKVMSGQDALVLMPTGGGKSLCYQIPAVISEGTCVVISPLISLMQDQVTALRANGIEAAYWNSTLTPKQVEEVENDFFTNKIKLLYVSPEKVVSQNFLTLLRSTKVSLFAIDEAHCISAWGHDFRPEYTQMQFLKRDFPHIPTLALTATADKLTRKDIIEQLHLQDSEVFVSSFDRPNLSLTVKPGLRRIEQIIAFIQERHSQSGIIYCMSRKSTEEVADKLKRQGIKAEFYHAQIPSHERARIQNDFLTDKIPVICATVAFGMGIDKSNVRWVIHYNLPKNMESYYQEIGRAGRDGTKADTLLFYSRQDAMTFRDMLTQNTENQENLELQLAKLERMLQYAESLICRRKILLNYFSETMEHDCGNCDVCLNPPKNFDGTLLAQKALSAVYRLNQQVGMGLLIDVLRGSARQEIIEKGYNTIKTYGAGRDLTFQEWQFYLLQMLNLGLIEIAYDRKYALALTPLSHEVLFNAKKIDLVQMAVHKKETESRQADSKPRSKKANLQEELFELLRQLRMRFANQRGVPAYQIFTDKTLEEMAKKMPANEASMANIEGMSERKMQLFGSPFMQLIVDFIKEKTIEGAFIQGSTYVLTHEMYKKGMSIEAIAKERGIATITIYSHLAYLYEKGESIELKKYVTKEEVQKVLDVLPLMQEPYQLTQLYQALNEQVEYHKIRFAIAYFNKNKKKLLQK